MKPIKNIPMNPVSMNMVPTDPRTKDRIKETLMFREMTFVDSALAASFSCLEGPVCLVYVWPSMVMVSGVVFMKLSLICLIIRSYWLLSKFKRGVCIGAEHSGFSGAV